MARTPALTLPPHTLSSASSRVRRALEHAERQVGFLQNMHANMVNAPGLLETYLFGSERFRMQSGFSPAEQEVAFLTISRENGCRYGVAAHSTVAERMSGLPRDVLEAIRGGIRIPDAKLRALNEFTCALLTSRGLVARAEVERFVGAGYSENQALSIVLAIAVGILSTWSNHLFQTEVDDQFAAGIMPPVSAAHPG